MQRSTSRRPSQDGRLVVFLILSLATSAAAASADAASLHLTWNACPLDAAATTDRVFSCQTSVGEHPLLCSMTLDQPVDQVLGLEIVIDVQHAAPALPDWWRFETGGCRAGTLLADDVFPGSSDCVDPWLGEATVTVASVEPGMPRGGASQSRIKITLGVPSTAPRSLNAGETYLAARLRLPNARTTGSPACAGCLEGACLVLNSIRLIRVGSPDTDVLVEAPGFAGKRATWQGGGGADCSNVPSRRSTWGAIKALHR